jgi:hypothetical protein
VSYGSALAAALTATEAVAVQKLEVLLDEATHSLALQLSCDDSEQIIQQ